MQQEEPPTGLEGLGVHVCVSGRTAYIGAIRSLVTSGAQLPALHPQDSLHPIIHPVTVLTVPCLK